MLKYGTDKPDLRNPLINVDATAPFANPTSGYSAGRSAKARWSGPFQYREVRRRRAASSIA